MAEASRTRDAEAARKAAAAERARRRYQRKRAGIRIVPVEIDAGTPDDPGTVELLVARGLITAEACSNAALLAFEIGALLTSIAEEGKISRVRIAPETVPASRKR